MALEKESVKKKEDAVVTVDLNKLLVPLAIVVAGLMVSTVIYFTNDGNSSTTTSPSVQGAVDNTGTAPAPEEAFPAASTTIDDDPFKGNKDGAKIAIVEFSDFECPFCQRHYQQTYRSLLENYVDSGDAIYVFRDYPLSFHPQAVPAANAANCARELGGDDTFFQYHDKLFEGDVASASKDTYIGYANDLGLDSGKFTSCVDGNKYKDEIDADMADGSSAGVTGTPGFVIGTLDGDGNVTGKRVSGAYPYADFERIIEEFLAQ